MILISDKCNKRDRERQQQQQQQICIVLWYLKRKKITISLNAPVMQPSGHFYSLSWAQLCVKFSWRIFCQFRRFLSSISTYWLENKLTRFQFAPIVCACMPLHDSETPWANRGCAVGFVVWISIKYPNWFHGAISIYRTAAHQLSLMNCHSFRYSPSIWIVCEPVNNRHVAIHIVTKVLRLWPTEAETKIHNATHFHS